MIEFPLIIVIVVLLLTYGIFSEKLAKGILSFPLFFCLSGIILSLFSDTLMRGGTQTTFVKVLLEFTLVVTLFSDASSIDLSSLKKYYGIPIRLLFVGLPLCILLGFIFSRLFFPEVGVVAGLLLALILAPTDAVLGQAVVSSEWIPEKIRQSINIESGINDGIVLPFVLLCLYLLNHEGPNTDTFDLNLILTFLLKQFFWSIVVGSFVGGLGSFILQKSIDKKAINDVFLSMSGILLALSAYFVAEEFHANGFIAAFIAGLSFRFVKKSSEVKHIVHFNESITNVMSAYIFLVFGLILFKYLNHNLDYKVIGYALLSLTVIRILPVIVSLFKTNLTLFDKIFIGWFGPRGTASILYLLMFVLNSTIKDDTKIIATIMFTVFLSIVFHGITAVFLSNKYKS